MPDRNQGVRVIDFQDVRQLLQSKNGFVDSDPLISLEMKEISGFPAVIAPSPFTGPVRFLAGDRSEYMESTHLEAIHALYPQAEIHTIANAGHWVHADQPAAVLEHFRKLLAAG